MSVSVCLYQCCVRCHLDTSIPCRGKDTQGSRQSRHAALSPAAEPSPGSPAESSVAPQRALPVPFRPLEAAPAGPRPHGGREQRAILPVRPRRIRFNKITVLRVFNGIKDHLE